MEAEKIKALEQRIQELEYRLGVLEKFLDSNGLIDLYKGETSDLNALRIEVLNDMRKERGAVSVSFDKEAGRNFYTKK